MATNALAPCVTRSSTTIVLTDIIYWSLSSRQLHMPSRWLVLMQNCSNSIANTLQPCTKSSIWLLGNDKNAKTFLMFPKTNSAWQIIRVRMEDARGFPSIGSFRQPSFLVKFHKMFTTEGCHDVAFLVSSLMWFRMSESGISGLTLFALSQWETSFQSNGVPHWLGANRQSALNLTLSVPNHLMGGTCLSSHFISSILIVKFGNCQYMQWWMINQK